MSKPITPDEVVSEQQQNIPSEVFDAFNALIAKHWNGGAASFAASEAANLIASKMNLSRSEVFDNKYLDVESVYRKSGWKVTYDAPAYNETYEATFTFSKR